MNDRHEVNSLAVAAVALSDNARLLIARHAQRTYPEECVGLLLGHRRENQLVIRAAVPLNNIAPEESRRHAYRMAPGELLAVQYIADDYGVELIGCYHSHPDMPAVPSRADRQGAASIVGSFLFLIQRVGADAAAELRAWQLCDDHFTEIEFGASDAGTNDGGTDAQR